MTAFMANQPSTIQFLGDESAPSVFNNGATGPRHIRAGVLHRLRAGRISRQPEAHVELRCALRLLHADSRSERPAGQVQLGYRRDRPEYDAGDEIDEDQLPAARWRDLCGDRKDDHPRRVRHVRRTGPDGRSGSDHRRFRPRQRDALVRRLSRVSARSKRRDADFHQQSEQPLISAASLSQRIRRFQSGSGSTPGRFSRISVGEWRRPLPTSAHRAAICSCAASPIRSSTW